MAGLFARSFELTEHGLYFTGWGELAYPLTAGEERQIRSELSTILVLVAGGFAVWAVFSLIMIGRSFGGNLEPVPAWWAARNLIYPAVIAYWVLTWTISLIFWIRIRLRLAGRETVEGIVTHDSGTYSLAPTEFKKSRNWLVDCLKPIQVALFGIVMTAFVAQGLGDICINHRGIGQHCEFVRIEMS